MCKAVQKVLEVGMAGSASKGTAQKSKKQGYNDRLDESLGMRDGKESGKSQSYKARRDESKGMEKSMGKPAYSGNRSSSQVGYPDTMNRG